MKGLDPLSALGLHSFSPSNNNASGPPLSSHAWNVEEEDGEIDADPYLVAQSGKRGLHFEEARGEAKSARMDAVNDSSSGSNTSLNKNSHQEEESQEIYCISLVENCEPCETLIPWNPIYLPDPAPAPSGLPTVELDAILQSLNHDGHVDDLQRCAFCNGDGPDNKSCVFCINNK